MHPKVCELFQFQGQLRGSPASGQGLGLTRVAWLRSSLPYSNQIFKIEREGESQRYKPFKELHNRRLLWHGSRTTNFAGILSQGLRIAPPEAPVVRACPGESGQSLSRQLVP